MTAGTRDRPGTSEATSANPVDSGSGSSAAREDWARRSPRARAGVLTAFRRRAAASVQALAATASAHHVAPGAAVVSEVLPLLEACRWLEREAPRLLAPRRLGRRGRPMWLGGVSTRVQRDPLGTVLIVGPGNYPLFLPGVQVLQALAAGNAVQVKPAPGASAAMRRLRDLLVEAGLPKGLFTVRDEAVPEVECAIASGEIDKVFVTGSQATGRAVLRLCAEAVVPATMELSGCDAVWVVPGADLPRVVGALAFGLGLNGGRTCIAPRRVLAAPGEAAALEGLLVSAVEAMTPVPTDDAVWEKLAPALREARHAGARVVRPRAAETDSAGPFLIMGSAGRCLDDADFFASWIRLEAVETEEALVAERSLPHALGASVFGPRPAAEALAERLECGVVCINDLVVPTADPRVPFGGRRRSGFGVTRGPEGLLEMTAPRVVAVRVRGRLRHLEPPEPEDEALLSGITRFAHEAGFGRRLRALKEVVAAARARGRGAAKEQGKQEKR